MELMKSTTIDCPHRHQLFLVLMLTKKGGLSMVAAPASLESGVTRTPTRKFWRAFCLMLTLLRRLRRGKPSGGTATT
jgi:hypothetical protein